MSLFHVFYSFNRIYYREKFENSEYYADDAAIYYVIYFDNVPYAKGKTGQYCK